MSWLNDSGHKFPKYGSLGDECEYCHTPMSVAYHHDTATDSKCPKRDSFEYRESAWYDFIKSWDDGGAETEIAQLAHCNARVITLEED